MGDLQKRVKGLQDDIDDFLNRVKRSAERRDAEELDILRLRGKYLLDSAEAFKEEALEEENREGEEASCKAVTAQLGAVLHMEAEGLKSTLDALKNADVADEALKNTEQIEKIREFREALWKEGIKS